MGWRNIGSQIFAMTLGQMSWGRGLPWFCNNDFTQALFPNMNWGQVGDSVQFNYTPTSSGTKKTEPKTEAEKKLEREQKEAENKEKAFEKRQLTKKFDKLKPLLTEFKKTLNEDVREEFDLIKDIEKYTKSVTKENYEKMLEIYNANKTKINAAKEKAVKEKLTSANNTEYTSKVTTLSTKIATPDDTFGGILDDGELKDDIDIMELLSTWNSNTTTSGSHIMNTIGAKYKATSDGTVKSKYEVLVNALHDKLSTAAENIDEDKLTEETKKLLKDAQDNFEKFDTIAKRFPTSEPECGVNYSNAFDNLYRAIRLAEAEIVEKELKESFDFLGDENPYKTSTIVTGTKTDLKNEFLNNVRTVTEPIAPPPAEKSIEEQATENGYRKTECNGVYYSDAENKHYYYDTSTKKFIEMVGVTRVFANGKCYKKHPSIKNKLIEVGSVTNGVYTPKGSAPATETTALADESVKDAIGTEYENGKKLGTDLFESLAGWNIDSSAQNVLNDINSNNIIGVLEQFNARRDNGGELYKQDGVIEWLTDDGIGMNYCNKICNALLQRASACGLNAINCNEFKEIQEFLGAKLSTNNNYIFERYNEEFFNSQYGTTGKKILYTTENAEKLDTYITALLEKIKKLNKTS